MERWQLTRMSCNNCSDFHCHDISRWQTAGSERQQASARKRKGQEPSSSEAAVSSSASFAHQMGTDDCGCTLALMMRQRGPRGKRAQADGQLAVVLAATCAVGTFCAHILII